MMSDTLISSLLLVLPIVSSHACLPMRPSNPVIPATPCETCAASLITITVTGAGAHRMDGDSTDQSGACAVRTFTCDGSTAVIEINGGVDGTVTDNGQVTFSVTCNAAGTAWMAGGVTVTQVECSSTL